MNTFKLMKNDELIGESIHTLDCGAILHNFAIFQLHKFCTMMYDATYVSNDQDVKCDAIVVLMNGKVCPIHKNRKDYLYQLIVKPILDEEILTISPYIECGVFECHDNIAQAVEQYNSNKILYKDYSNTIIGWHIFQ